MKYIPESGITVTNCRFCGAELTETVADLGVMPPANNYLRPEDLDAPEAEFPLNVLRCTECHLVQVGFAVPPQHLFEDYSYFSSYSTSWVEHARRFADEAIDRFGLSNGTRVLEIGSNDGYLLQHFARRGIDVLGVDPAANIAAEAMAKGISTRVAFFGEELAEELLEAGKQADLIVGNNVFAHVPDINGFTEGLRMMLKPDGVLSLEFPHLLRLLEETQFDTIYHEHYSYYSMLAVDKILERHGLRAFDVQQLKSHGGSLRVLACHSDSTRFEELPGVEEIRRLEAQAHLDRPDIYREFESKLPDIRDAFREFVSETKRSGRKIVGYSAPAKGNTFLNYCDVGADDIEFVADLNPAKQNHFLPGSRIPIRPPDELFEVKPDYVLILAWNLREEISRQLARIAVWGGRFVIGIPFTEIFAP